MDGMGVNGIGKDRTETEIKGGFGSKVLSLNTNI